jgi:serine/threonine-protein kinase RsbW
VCYRFERLRAELEVRDEGTGFDPNGVADPTTDSGILRTCGRGMLMMRSLFDEMRYLHGGRLVYLVKRASRTKACAA